MTKRSIVISPHPDDETLGAGGTLLRKKAEGERIAWLIITKISVDGGWPVDRLEARTSEIQRIKRFYKFDEVYALNFPTTNLDTIPMRDLVEAISNVFKAFEPEDVFVPHPGDIHTDHSVVFRAVASCTKWFRYPSVKRILAYETLSETDFGLIADQAFNPNVFVDITGYIKKKLKAMNIYASEVGQFPFPRSNEAILALASLRGAASGYKSAEAFQLLRERY